MNRPAKILVVDDSTEIHDMVELLFSLGGGGPPPVVLHASQGQEGLGLLARNQDIDVIVLDLVMPVLDGFAFLEAMRADRRFHTIPVCVFSGNRTDATRALKLGASDFVNKPGDYLEIRLRLQNLIDSKRRAEAAERAKVDFLAVVSHELRTPMNGILGIVQTLQDGPATPEQSSYLELLERSSQKMLSLVNNVIGFLESENSLGGLPRIGFSLREVVHGVHQEILPEAVRARVGFELLVAPQVPDRLLGLPDKLRLVLWHLVGNAVKFSPGGRVVLQVDKEETGPEVPVSLRFVVKDTGVGFPPEWRDRLFEPFTQLDGTETRKFGGLGIGLSIASRLVQRMGGTLHVESELGRGSLFQFSLVLGEEVLP